MKGQTRKQMRERALEMLGEAFVGEEGIDGHASR